MQVTSACRRALSIPGEELLKQLLPLRVRQFVVHAGAGLRQEVVEPRLRRRTGSACRGLPRQPVLGRLKTCPARDLRRQVHLAPFGMTRRLLELIELAEED